MECTASARAARSPDQAIMELDDVLANRQPQTKTIDLPRQSGIHPVEAVEDPVKVFIGNAQPMIADTDLHHLPPLLPGRLNISALDRGVIAFRQSLCFPLSIGGFACRQKRLDRLHND